MQDTVKILGAGPAGLAAAITLARGGKQVFVIEQRESVGARYNGNLQMLTNFPDTLDAKEELRYLCDSELPEMWPQNRALLFGPNGKQHEATSAEPFGYLLMRGPGGGSFDRSLYRSAERLGVQFEFGRRGDPDAVDIVAIGGARAQGVAREWHGPVDLPDGFHVRFNHETCPGGYGYLLVAGGKAVLGAAVVREHKRIEAAFSETVTWFHRLLGTPVIDTHSLVGSVDLFQIQTAVGVHSERYAGEAGGFCDALFGFGIRASLQSGRIAATSILTGKSYDRLWRRHFGNRLETGLVNRFLYESGGNSLLRALLPLSGYRDFRKLGQSLCGKSVLRRMLLPVVRSAWRGVEDSPHGPRSAWHRAVK